MRSKLNGFTLVELLVTVAIIVVLLALLVPAMDQAMYQSELAMCAATMDAAGSGVTTYAFDHNRWYPYRQVMRNYKGGIENDPLRLTIPVGISGVAEPLDDRTMLRGYLQINKHFQDPLTAKVDVEVDPAFDTWVMSTYVLWFSVQYTGAAFPRTYAGSFKLGQGFGFEDETYTVLLGDYDRTDSGGRGYVGPHPDKQGLRGNHQYQREANPYGLEAQYGSSVSPAGGYATLSWWGYGERGPVDLNFAMQDGSVRRYNNVEDLEGTVRGQEEAGLRDVPAFMSGQRWPLEGHWVPAD